MITKTSSIVKVSVLDLEENTWHNDEDSDIMPLSCEFSGSFSVPITRTESAVWVFICSPQVCFYNCISVVEPRSVTTLSSSQHKWCRHSFEACSHCRRKSEENKWK